MAIITDATGRQLAQAVGGIDTGGLAKDTTLQATNTALGNMNLTQQGITTAITNLGTILGSDKANISGNNIADKATFRKNIGLEYSVTTQTYEGLTWTIVKLGNLYFLSTEITIPANTTPTTWGNLYIYRNINKQWWTLPVNLSKKIADLSYTDGSIAGIPIAYTDISSKPNSATTADIARPTTTSSAITVRKFICGYVA